jgi:DHA1 family bicyclomycin/chloramphenicol resistance-like MFS transporter
MNTPPGADTTTERRGWVFLLTLALVTLIAPLAVHFFLPVLPSVRDAFGVDEALAQLTFSISLFVMAFATLAYGSLSDRYGRRPVLLSGIGLFLAGSALSAIAPNIEVLLAARLIQAVGAACSMTLARAIARDLFGDAGLVRALSYLTMAYTLGPMIAPPLGGLLADALGWRSVFWAALGAGAVIALAVVVVLGETLPTQPKGGARQSYAADYAALFRSLRFTANVCQTGFSSGSFFTFAAGASFLMQDYLHRPASEYGLYFLFFPFGYWFGNLTSVRLGGRVRSSNVVLAGSLILTGTVAAFGGIVALGLVAPLTIFIPGFLMTFAQGMALPHAQAGAINAVPNLAGTASGVGVFKQMIWAAVFTQVFGLVADGTPWPLVAVISVSTALALTSGIVAWRADRAGTPAQS